MRVSDESKGKTNTMANRSDDDPKPSTIVERVSDRELLARRTVDGPVDLVFDAWTTPERFQRWWVPESFGLTLLSCEMDVRAGGGYRLVFRHGDSTMAFFGTYRDVTPPHRLVWTNEEDGGETVTTVTFAETGGRTSIEVHDLHPSKEALDAAIASGATGALPEQLDALDAWLGEHATPNEGP
jgi:uncharacterized protein YndB with AHSA1/START domain